jgi:hypothetical protein
MIKFGAKVRYFSLTPFAIVVFKVNSMSIVALTAEAYSILC